jgi:hypothetical protein
MRLPVAAALLSVAALAHSAPASAQMSTVELDASRYCARYSDGSTNCGFYNRAQCAAAVSGVGGTCQISPYGEVGLDANASARRGNGAPRR